MGFKKTDPKEAQPPIDARKIFIGRRNEIEFFVQQILKPEDPTYNIISISGVGGVGKSTLLARFIDEARAPEFKDYCLIALVDDQQTTPASIIEKFADQLHSEGEFEKALAHYKEALRKLQSERETWRDTLLHKAPELAGTMVEDVPFAGGILKAGAGVTTEFFVKRYRTRQLLKDAERLEDPLRDLTNAFIKELNHLADTQVTLSVDRTKRRRRVILFFDTFEKLAAEVTPWLLDYFLEADLDISTNIVLVVAGRDAIERSVPGDPKRWLPYYDSSIISSVSLESFTEAETRAYLTERGITDPDRVESIWQLSKGLPLYLSLLTYNPQGKVDPTADVVANFLRWIPEREQMKRRLVLDAALLSRPFNQDELAAFTYLPEQERVNLYIWLTEQHFVLNNPQDGRYRYLESVQGLFSRHLYQRSPTACHATRRALANYYERLLENIQTEGNREEAYNSIEWLELTLALASQLFFLPDEVNHIRAIEQILKAYHLSKTDQEGETVRVLRELTQEQFGNQINPHARETIKLLMQYLEADLESQEFLAAASGLLERVVHEPTFSSELWARLYRNRGEAYRLLKDYPRAIQDFDRAVELDPHDAGAYASRGQAYRLLKDYPRAIQDFDQTVELDPKAGWAYGSRGEAYRLLKDYPRAIQDFDQAVELDPKAAWAYGNRGITYGLLKDYPRAIQDFDWAVELDPHYVWAYGSRGITYRLLKDYPRAIQDFDRAVELNPKVAWVYGSRGITYRLLKDYPRAIQDFDRTVELNPKAAWVYGARGLTRLWLKDVRHATADYTRSWELDPTDVSHGWMTEWSKMCQERVDLDAAERLEAIAAVDSQNYAAYVCRGVARWIHEHFHEALAELDLAIPLDPEEWDAYFWKGMACASLGRDEEALTALEKALAVGLPPVLLSPLHWLEQDKQDFYKNYVLTLLTRYE
jgi:tetratricopeptide (TPR) repeat protein